MISLESSHGRMARGGHRLPKKSLGPAMPDPSMPRGQATPETALQPYTRFRGAPPAAVFYPFGHPTPYAYESSRNRGILFQDVKDFMSNNFLTDLQQDVPREAASGPPVASRLWHMTVTGSEPTDDLLASHE
jgi:hypothetical protein